MLLDESGLRIGSAPAAHLWPYADLDTAKPLQARASDVLILPRSRPGVTLYVEDAAFVADLAARAPHLSQKAFRRAGLKAAAPVGLVAAAIAAAVVVLDLSPSKAIARMMPEAARDRLGRNVLATLPETRTCAGAEGRSALDALVVRLRPDLKDKPHKVAVLDWRLVNALAVPGGSIVLTRGILERATSGDEIAGVIAHEMGHGAELHPEAGLVRHVGFWALIQLVFTGTPGALGNAGSALAQLAYSRGYEREADDYALRLLRAANISPKAFAGFFKRMDQEGRGGRDSPRSRRSVSDVLDSHPSTPERIAAIERAGDYPATPALTDAQWQALKRICTGASATGRIDTSNTDIEPAKPDPNARLKQAEAAVAANPRDARAVNLRGDIHLSDGRAREALADFSRAIDLEAGNAGFHYNRGRAHQNLGQYGAALADYGEATRLNPRHSSAFAARGATHRLLKRPDMAQADFDAALAINPRNEYALYQRGLLAAERERFADSERDFGKVIEGNKSYAFAYVRRAEARERLRRRDLAVADYREALAASPSSPDADMAFKLARERLKALGAE